MQIKERCNRKPFLTTKELKMKRRKYKLTVTVPLPLNIGYETPEEKLWKLKMKQRIFISKNERMSTKAVWPDPTSPALRNY